MLAARAFLMQDNSLLPFAVADVADDGERWRALESGKDPQLDAAALTGRGVMLPPLESRPPGSGFQGRSWT